MVTTDVVSRVRSKLSAVQRAFSAATEAISTIRADIDAVRNERQKIASAPVPASEATELLDRMLDGWIIAGQNSGISVDGIVGTVLAGQPVRIELHRPATLGTMLTLLTPLLRSHLRAALLSELERRYADTPGGLPADERRCELARLDEQILSLERSEEQALQVAEVNGLAIDRRENADVRAILGIAE